MKLRLLGRYGAMMSVICPVERVAEDTAGGAEEAGAQGEASPSYVILDDNSRKVIYN